MTRRHAAGKRQMERLETRAVLTAVPLSFAPHDIAVGVDQPSNFLVADFDGDTVPDVLANSFRTGVVQWTRGTGDGGYEQFRPFSFQAEDSVVLAADDLDQDGDSDLIVLRSQDQFYFVENLSDVNDGWAGGVRLGVDGSPVDLAFGDFDSDGDRDIAQLLNAGGGKPSLVLHRSEGGKSFTSRIDREWQANQVELADMDGDSQLDIVLASASSHWLRNNDGVFGDPVLIGEGGQIDIGDYDNDGDADVVSVGARAGVEIYSNDGGGEFVTSDSKFLNSDDRRGRQAFFADVDGDSDLDVLIESDNDDDMEINWMENQDGEFFSPAWLPGVGLEDGYVIGVFDVDQNGTDEFIGFTSDDDLLFLGRLDVENSRTDRRDIPEFGPYDVKSLYSADLDGDGDLDVVSSSRSDGDITWYRNTGTGEFNSATTISSSVKRSRQVIPVDADQDGDYDLLSVGVLQNVEWFENDGSGNFAAAQTIDDRRDFRRHTSTGDIDENGTLDVVAASSDRISLYRTGSGVNVEDVFTRPGESGSIEDVALADVDGDGDQDIAFGWRRFESQSIYAILNDEGDFSRTPTEIIRVGSELPYLIDAADFNSDGQVDFVVSTGRELRLYDRAADGHRTVVLGEVETVGLEVDDVNRDGATDILVSGGWFSNDGDGRFTFRSGDWERHVSLADLDGDGDRDVLAAIHENGVRWFESRVVADSNHDGVFDSSDFVAVFQAGEYEDGIAGNSTFEEGDWNGDGDFDSSDFVFAFRGGHYQREAAVAAAIEAVLAETARDHDRHGKSSVR